MKQDVKAKVVVKGGNLAVVLSGAVEVPKADVTRLLTVALTCPITIDGAEISLGWYYEPHDGVFVLDSIAGVHRSRWSDAFVDAVQSAFWQEATDQASADFDQARAEARGEL